jgi:hypothetical protein
MRKGSKNSNQQSSPLPEDLHQPSLFGYYVIAAKVAAQMGIGLGHAFSHYVKPHMVADATLVNFTDEERDALFGR